MTPLRQRLIEEIALRGYSDKTKEAYVRAVACLAQNYGRPPDGLSDEELCAYLLHLHHKKIVAGPLLTGSEVDIRQSVDEIAITLAPQHHQPVDTIVVLELDGQASQITPVMTGSDSLAFRRWAKASGAGNCRTAWLDMDFGRPRTINQAIFYSNRYWQRGKLFELQR